jgi:hypothetical protein
MLQTKTNRLLGIALLGLFLLVLLGVSRSTDHVEAAEAALDGAAQGAFKTYMPVVSTQQWQTNCRYGVGNASNQRAKQWVDFLGAGHYINFAAQQYGPPLPQNVELMPQIRMQQEKLNGVYLPKYTISPPLTMAPEGLGPLVKANPRGLWIVGNEPDVANASQDDIYPQFYAKAYHDTYTFIKQVDPHAQVAIAGLSMMTPGRLQYLDIVWDTYQKEYGTTMPVDVWNMHLYILSEIRADGGPGDGKVALGTDPKLAKKAPDGSPAEQRAQCPRDDVYCRAEHDDMGIFMGQIVALRSWMKAHGQQNKPLLLSEFSLLYPFLNYDDPVNPTECYLMDEFGKCFTQKRVTTFLNKTLDYLESARDPNLGYPADNYRLVQQWTWYSMWAYDNLTGQSSNLLVNGYENLPLGSESGLTQVGRGFRDRARSSQRTYNLAAGTMPDIERKALNGKADVPLEVGFFNNGSIGIEDTFKVTFYKDAALTQVIGTTEIVPRVSGMINGCSWGRSTDVATFVWRDVPIGQYTVWAKIDSANRISGETSETDNVTSGKVTVRS